jgi:ABC-type molybdenum transport system ATPase subunit/photorepair protein PhrA
MVYRESKSAIERARERLEAANERVEFVRAQIGVVAAELHEAQRKRELARLQVGAATASVRRIEALIAASGGSADLDRGLTEAQTRLEAVRAEIPVCELSVGERREALRVRRREMGAAELERSQAERELRRLGS